MVKTRSHANYILLNKDDKLLAFRTETDALGTRITEIESYSDRRPLGWRGIERWIDDRNRAKRKNHFRNMLKDWRMDTPDGFLQMSHALGLNDTLWVRPEVSTLRWTDVSLYANPFNDIAARTAFEAESGWPRPSSTSPEFTMDGSYPKCWCKETDGILMYKTGSTGLEPYAEFMAAHIAKTMQDVRVVEYGLKKSKSRLCSTCRLFTDESTGFVPAARLLPQNAPHNMTNALDLCSGLGFGQEFCDMVVLDAITFNQDRHMSNFGFLVDNDTFRIKSFAPLFDFNISMLCFATNVDLETDAALAGYFERNDVGHKLGGDFVEVAQALMTPERRARMPKTVSLPRHPLYNLPDERMARLAEILEQNYDCIRNDD